jgi:ABC-type nickel/cobalt efflux system permease component RcnA
MKKAHYIFIAVLFLTASAAAHPLGNFSVNQYSRLEVGRNQVKIRQILDLAEIPAFQEKAAIDTDRDGAFSEAELNAYADRITPPLLNNLLLTLNGEPLEIRAESKEIRLETGAGSLPTLKIRWNLIADFAAGGAISRFKFENKNYVERLGWNEIVVNRANGVSIFDSTAFGSGVTDELKAYPQETLDAPLRERSAEFSFTAKALPDGAKLLQNRDGHASAAVQRDKLAELIAVPEITPAIALFGLFIAFGLGAMHAMSPGHGKTVVGAYLVGSRGTIKHAAFLGATVTITHTLGVFALGLLTLFASQYILPERLLPFLNFVSGLLVFFIGISLFKDRLFASLGWRQSGHHHEHSEESNHHGEPHAHDDFTHAYTFTHRHDGHTHSHLPPEQVSWRSLLGLGISGGLLPCPSALVLMLSAISLGRIGYGLILTLVFSLGLAATLTVVGLIFLYLGKAFAGARLAENRLLKTVPVFSAFVIACVGAVICYNSLA